MPPQSRAPHNKLQRLPAHAKVHKRPLVRPAIASPYTSRSSSSPSSAQHSVYISTRTPFVSAIKRVRRLLAHASTRRAQSTHNSRKPHQHNQQHQRHQDPVMAAALAEAALEQSGEAREEVVLMASGRSIEKAMALALYFQQQADCRVSVRTGTAAAVDDISEGEREGGGAAGSNNDDGDGEGEEAKEELPETRVRHTSVLEVAVALR